MIKVLADAQLSQKLRETKETFQIVDETGGTLGFFDPMPIAAPGVAAARSPNSIERLKELCKQTGGRPLAEILGDLEKADEFHVCLAADGRKAT